MLSGKAIILCLADSVTRLTSIARTVKKLGYAVHIVHSPDQAVGLAANPANGFEAIVIDEDMVLDGFSLARSLKMVSAIPILLVCDKGSEGKALPAGVDHVTANGSRQEIAAGLKKLLTRAAGAAQQ